MRIPSQLILAAFSLVPLGSALGQSYPLSENRWSNPEFVDRFLGTFGVDTEKAPSITTEEAGVFRAVAEVGADPAAAVRLLQRSITPESSGAMDFALGNFLVQSGQLPQAINAYQAAIRKFPNFGRAYKNLGLAYVQKQDYAAALPHLLKSLEILGGDGGLYGLIGFCHLNTGNFGPALDAYRFALVFQPNSRDWRLGQLKALQNLRDYAAVEALILRYIEEQPDEPEFWLQQANAFIAQRKYLEAASNFEIVRLLGAADDRVLVLLGDIYVNLGAPGLALDPYRAALATGKVKPSNALDIAKALSRRLPPEEFEGFLTSISNAYPSGLPAQDELLLLTLQAGNAMTRGQDEEAIQLLSQVVARDPLNGNALLTLGSFHFNKNDLETALNYYDRAEKVESVRLDSLLGAARVLVKQEKYTAAIRRLKAAQSIEPRPFVADYIATLERFNR